MPTATISRRRPGSAIRLAALLAALSLVCTGVAAAAGRDVLFIHTTKPLGPVPGEFSTSGAFVDSGTLVTEQRIVSAVPSPFGVVTHRELLFEGRYGTRDYTGLVHFK